MLWNTKAKSETYDFSVHSITSSMFIQSQGPCINGVLVLVHFLINISISIE